MVVGGVTRGTRRRVGRKCCGRVGLRPRCTRRRSSSRRRRRHGHRFTLYTRTKLQQLYTHYQQHCTRDEVPHTHTRQPRSQGCVIRQTRLRSHIRSLRGSHAPRRHTSTQAHTHTQQSGRCSSSVRHLLPSLLSAAKTSTHTHTAHTRLEGLRNSRAVVVITGRGRPCGLP